MNLDDPSVPNCRLADYPEGKDNKNVCWKIFVDNELKLTMAEAHNFLPTEKYLHKKKFTTFLLPLTKLCKMKFNQYLCKRNSILLSCLGIVYQSALGVLEDSGLLASCGGWKNGVLPFPGHCMSWVIYQAM